LGEASKERMLWEKAKEAVITHLQAADIKKGWAVIEKPVSGREKSQKEKISIPTGKILPISPDLRRTPGSSRVLLAVAFVLMDFHSKENISTMSQNLEPKALFRPIPPLKIFRRQDQPGPTFSNRPSILPHSKSLKLGYPSSAV
jgi:hypothetical protein